MGYYGFSFKLSLATIFYTIHQLLSKRNCWNIKNSISKLTISILFSMTREKAADGDGKNVIKKRIWGAFGALNGRHTSAMPWGRVTNMCLVLKLDNGKVVSIARELKHPNLSSALVHRFVFLIFVTRVYAIIILSRFFKTRKDEILNAAQIKILSIQSIILILKPIQFLYVQTQFIISKSFLLIYKTIFICSNPMILLIN